MRDTLFRSGPTAAPRRQPQVPPSRRPVVPTGRQFRAKFFSQKGQRLIQCESLLEMRIARLFEFSPCVREFSEQPPALKIRINGRKRKYTPDFVVHRVDGRPWLVEVKPSEIAGRHDMRVKHAAAHLAAAELGYDFRVITEHVLYRRGGDADICELLAIRLQSRIRCLGLSMDDVQAAEPTPVVPTVLVTAVSGSRRLSFGASLRLLGGGTDGRRELMRLLAAGLFGWRYEEKLTDKTEIHLSRESDDDELFAR